jgi:hypothetical protein
MGVAAASSDLPLAHSGCSNTKSAAAQECSALRELSSGLRCSFARSTAKKPLGEHLLHAALCAA